MSKITAIVLAAGKGSRMQSKTKKQFIEINGKPLLWYSLFAFEKSGVDQIILVTGESDIEFCKNQIVDKYCFTKVTDVVAGGKERYQSVENGLKKVKGEIVLIHDGARPFITQEVIERCIEGAEKYEACVAGVPAKDTIKITNDEGVVVNTPDRRNVWITQTPQAFSSELIINAYNSIKKEKSVNITDDAMVVENFANHPVRFVEGDYRNIKVTTPEDINVAKTFLDSMAL